MTGSVILSSDGRMCVPHTDWAAKIGGALAFLLGVALTATVVGSVIGIPLVLGSLGLLQAPPTLRGTPCADPPLP